MSTQAGSFAKVTPPTFFKCSHRTRLFKHIDSRKKFQIFWIAGAAGSGKTTLVRTYIDHLNQPCLWYQLDPGDNDPASFFYYLGLAAKKTVPKMRRPFPVLTPDYLPGLPVFSLRYFEMLYNRLKLPCTMVFDNYQDLADDSPIHALLRQGIEHLPKGVTVFLVSRNQPPPALVRLRAQERMEQLEWQDLRLTLDETRDIASLRLEKGLDDQAVEALHSRTDGWVAGLSLMLESTLPDKDGFFGFHSETGFEVFDYFVGEVFDNSSEELKHFLLHTALLPEFSLDMARSLTGSSKSQSLLNDLCRKNYFITRIMLKKSFYRYHPLFREFLISRAHETLSDKALADLHEQSARILEKTQNIDDAIVLWAAINNWEAISRLIVVHAPSHLEQGRFQRVDAWLNHLPETRIATDPWLLLSKSLCRMFTNPLEAKTIAEQAYTEFTQKGDVIGRLLSWPVVIDAIEFAQGNFAPLDGWITEFNRFKPEYDALTDETVKTRVAGSMIVALTFGKPWQKDLPQWIDQAVFISHRPDSANHMVKACFQAVWYHTSFTGDLIRARFYLDRMQMFARKPSAQPMTKIMSDLMACNFFEFSGQTDKSLKVGARGLELSRKTGLTIWESPTQGAMAQAHLNCGNLKEAHRYLTIVEENMEMTTHLGQVMSLFARIRYLLIKDEIQRAEVLIDQMPAMYRQLNMWFCYPMPELQKAQAQGLKGNFQKALSLIQKALKKAVQSKSSHHKTVFLFEKAHIELALGRDRAGLKSLKDALTSAKKRGLMFCFFDLPSVTAALCTRAIQEGIETEYAKEIIQCRKLVPDRPLLHLKAWPWRAKVTMLGPFSIFREEKVVRFGRKVPKKPLELLKLIITLGADRVHEGRIADILWPDADGDHAHNTLQTNLHRLRKLIGSSEAIINKEQRISLDRHLVWTDVWTFEAMARDLLPIAGAADCTFPEHHDVWVRDCRDALDLYRGKFLPDEDWTPEIIAGRAELHSNFIRIAVACGRHMETFDQWEQAIDIYEKSLSKDLLCEVFYYRLIRCHQHLNQKSEAMDVYNRCRVIFTKTLGTDPPLSVKNLVQALKKNQVVQRQP